jgi:hypothetical protein
MNTLDIVLKFLLPIDAALISVALFGLRASWRAIGLALLYIASTSAFCAFVCAVAGNQLWVAFALNFLITGVMTAIALWADNRSTMPVASTRPAPHKHFVPRV